MSAAFLDQIGVARPCSAKWDEMAGDDRVRNCATCSHDVYDLSAMSRTEAEDFVTAREGSACVRFFRRADGTVLTSDCPAGVRAAWRRMAWAASALLAGGFAAAAMLAPRDTRGVPQVAPVKQFYELVRAIF